MMGPKMQLLQVGMKNTATNVSEKILTNLAKVIESGAKFLQIFFIIN